MARSKKRDQSGGLALSTRGIAWRAIAYLGLVALSSPLLRGAERPSHGPLLADLTASALRIADVPAKSTGDVVSGAGFAMQVAPVCDGADLAIILGLAIIFSPASWRLRFQGLVAGIFVTQLFNLGRLVSMFIVGAYYPEHFELFHQVLWQAVAIAFCVGVYALWLSLTPPPIQELEPPV